MMLCRRTGPGRICKGWRCLSICWNFQMTGERNTERFCAGTNGCTDTLNGEQWNERERERERAASRRKRTGCRETEPAGCCSAFKSCCGYSPHPHVLHTHTHTRTHARTHARTHTADTHWLSQQCRTDWLYIYYALASSALRPDASYNYCNSLAPWGHASCLAAWLIISLFFGN